MSGAPPSLSTAPLARVQARLQFLALPTDPANRAQVFWAPHTSCAGPSKPAATEQSRAPQGDAPTQPRSTRAAAPPHRLAATPRPLPDAQLRLAAITTAPCRAPAAAAAESLTDPGATVRQQRGSSSHGTARRCGGGAEGGRESGQEAESVRSLQRRRHQQDAAGSCVSRSNSTMHIGLFLSACKLGISGGHPPCSAPQPPTTPRPLPLPRRPFKRRGSVC